LLVFALEEIEFAREINHPANRRRLNTPPYTSRASGAAHPHLKWSFTGNASRRSGHAYLEEMVRLAPCADGPDVNFASKELPGWQIASLRRLER